MHCDGWHVFLQPVVLQESLSATCKIHESIGRDQAKIEFKSHSKTMQHTVRMFLRIMFLDCEKSIVGRKSMELIMFDILKESVSIHQPLPRMIASM